MSEPQVEVDLHAVGARLVASSELRSRRRAQIGIVVFFMLAMLGAWAAVLVR
jgi:hypothetical protein